MFTVPGDGDATAANTELRRLPDESGREAGDDDGEDDAAAVDEAGAAAGDEATDDRLRGRAGEAPRAGDRGRGICGEWGTKICWPRPHD